MKNYMEVKYDGYIVRAIFSEPLQGNVLSIINSDNKVVFNCVVMDSVLLNLGSWLDDFFAQL